MLPIFSKLTTATITPADVQSSAFTGAQYLAAPFQLRADAFGVSYLNFLQAVRIHDPNYQGVALNFHLFRSKPVGQAAIASGTAVAWAKADELARIGMFNVPIYSTGAADTFEGELQSSQASFQEKNFNPLQPLDGNTNVWVVVTVPTSVTPTYAASTVAFDFVVQGN